MSSTYKTALGLNYWVENDVPTLFDFNDDNRILDEKITDSKRSIDDEIANLKQGIDRSLAELKQVMDQELRDLKQMLDQDLSDLRQSMDYFVEFRGVKTQTFQIAPEHWRESDYLAYPYEAVIPMEQIGEMHDANILFDMKSAAKASQIGIANCLGETRDGQVVLFAFDKLDTALSGTCVLTRREEAM